MPKQKRLLIQWSLDIQWRNIWGSGLLFTLAENFDEIYVVGPRKVDDLPGIPANVRAITSPWLREDPWLRLLARILHLYFFRRFSKLNQFRRSEMLEESPKLFRASRFLGYPVFVLFYFHLFLV